MFEPCFQLQTLGRQERSLREEKAAAGRAEEALLQGQEQADASSWGLHFLRPTSLLVYPLLLPTTSEPVCPRTCVASKSAASRGFPILSSQVCCGEAPTRKGDLPPCRHGDGAVPEHPTPFYILLRTQPAHSNLATLTLKKIIPRKTHP